MNRKALPIAMILVASFSGASISAQTASSSSGTPSSADMANRPNPIDDTAKRSYALVDLLEYQRTRGIDVLRWDASGWYGGDKRRLWFKSEGEQYSKGRAGGEADLQALYGTLVSPFFDLQAGMRVETHFERTTVTRGFAVLALQGLAPYGFEVEPEVFLSNKGKVSMRFRGSRDLLLSQRLILQPRVESEIAFQKDEIFGVDSGVNTAEAGLRLRYEIRRELAPYVGVAFRQSFGAAKARVLREGGTPNQLQFVIGLRFWR